MRVAFLGATKGMGRALARLMAERGDSLCVLARDLGELSGRNGDSTFLFDLCIDLDRHGNVEIRSAEGESSVPGLEQDVR